MSGGGADNTRGRPITPCPLGRAGYGYHHTGHPIAACINSNRSFPLNSVKALRGAFVAITEGKVSAYSRACFEAYWCHDKDLSQEDELRQVVEEASMDVSTLFAKIAEEPLKLKLFETTNELITRGGFGSPTFSLDKEDMYFGNDRLELMQAAIGCPV